MVMIVLLRGIEHTYDGDVNATWIACLCLLTCSASQLWPPNAPCSTNNSTVQTEESEAAQTHFSPVLTHLVFLT